MKIEIAQSAGFCFGVKRAVEMANKALEEKRKPVYSIGSLIHNPSVKKELEEKGYQLVEKPEDVPEDSIFVVRSHGIAKEILEELEKRDIEIIDATCPFVKRAQKQAEKFHKENYQVIIFGDPNHAEVIGINSWTDNSAIIVQNPEEAKLLPNMYIVGVLSQTTQKVEIYQEVVEALKNIAKEVIIENTICSDTGKKQAEARELAGRVEVMIVVGGKDSSNTKKLAEISQKSGTQTYHIEDADELKKEWFANIEKVGIAAGASTPQKLIEAVMKAIADFQ